MTLAGWAQIAVVIAIATLLVRPVGSYIYRVFEGEHTRLDWLLGPLERSLFRFLRIDDREEYEWPGYVLRLLAIDFSFILLAYLILRIQGHLPLNPTHAAGLKPDLAFNTSISFATNTNWQAYAGEMAVSNLSQMMLTMLMFIGPTSGIVLAIAFMRGLSRKENPHIGNLFADFVRCILRILLPLAVVVALVIVPLGVTQTLKGPQQVTTLEGQTQDIPGGPVASLESIKHIGTNGGGFFNANAAHPFENPSPVTNVLFIVLMLLIPTSLTYALGRYLKNQRQGWVIFLAILLLFILFIGLTYAFESKTTPAMQQGGVTSTGGNMEGKEVRNGVGGSALFGTTTTVSATGSTNSTHDSYSAMGGMMLIGGMMLNTVFGGCGAGMINIMIFVIFTVFIAGLMVGRTPEFHGKKIEGREVKLAVVALLAHPVCILAFTALSMSIPSVRSAALNTGSHGLTEIAYAFTSATANNGSAMAGLAANTAFYNTTLGIAMLIGRFLVLIPMVAVAGSLAAKKTVPPTEGTFRTDNPLFAGLLIGIIIVISALTFFPILALGPIAEQLAWLKVF